jgi:hypothetical protein
MAQQTAVQWFADHLKLVDKNAYNDLIEILEQAKQMEKEQIIRAYKDGCLDSNTDGSNFYFRSKQYYNETYGE